MKKPIQTTIAAMLLAIPIAAWAAGPFDGTWVGDVATAKIEGKPDSYLLQNGQFTCGACYPELKIPADGKSHKVTGHDYYDEASATVIGPKSVKVSMSQAGKKFSERTLTVSADGEAMTEDWVSYQGPTPAPAKFAYTRVTAGPAGAHPVSGSWKQDTKNSTMSTDLVTVTYQQTADGLKMSVPTGQSYDARFDGKEYLTAGDPGKTMVSLEKLGPKKIRETDKRNGQITDVITMEVSADGHTMHVVDEVSRQGIKIIYTAKKQ
jgi:hypothetical protein